MPRCPTGARVHTQTHTHTLIWLGAPQVVFQSNIEQNHWVLMAASADGQTRRCIRKQVPLVVAQGSSLFLNGLVHLVSSLQSQPERSPALSAMEMLPLSFVWGL